MSSISIYSELLRRISEEDPPFYIFGGFAEEALLSGKTTRKHEDVDVLVLRKNLDGTLEKFRNFGFVDYETYLTTPNGQPTVLHSEKDGLHVELCVFDQEGSDTYFDIFGGDEKTKFRIYLPEQSFDYPKTSVDGVEIQTISPLAQYQIRAALDITKSFGDFREKDIKSQAELKAKYFFNLPEKQLMPRIEQLRF